MIFRPKYANQMRLGFRLSMRYLGEKTTIDNNTVEYFNMSECNERKNFICKMPALSVVLALLPTTTSLITHTLHEILMVSAYFKYKRMKDEEFAIFSEL